MGAGAAQLAGVGISLSIYATVTKLFNISLLAVTTSNVATVVGESKGATQVLSWGMQALSEKDQG
jgi:hypothetical protein